MSGRGAGPEGPDAAPGAHVGPGQVGRRAGVGAAAGLPPVRGGLVGEGGHGGLEAGGEGPGLLVLARQQGIAERDGGVRRLRQLLPLAQDPAGALQVNRDDGDAAADRQVGGAAAERLPPAVGAAAALGEDQQAPVLGDEVGGQRGGLAAHLGAFDRDGPHGECGDRTADPGAEEVVGGGTDDEAVAPRLGDGGEQQRRVGVAVVVGGEDDRPVEPVQPVEALDRR